MSYLYTDDFDGKEGCAVHVAGVADLFTDHGQREEGEVGEGGEGPGEGPLLWEGVKYEIISVLIVELIKFKWIGRQLGHTIFFLSL